MILSACPQCVDRVLTSMPSMMTKWLQPFQGFNQYTTDSTNHRVNPLKFIFNSGCMPNSGYMPTHKTITLVRQCQSSWVYMWTSAQPQINYFGIILVKLGHWVPILKGFDTGEAPSNVLLQGSTDLLNE